MNLRIWLRSEWDRVAGFGLVLLGAILLFVGYQGVKESPFLAEEIAYIASGGLGGLFCMGLGVGLLLSADLHDEWYKLDRIEAAIRGEPLPEGDSLLEVLGENGSGRGRASGPADSSPVTPPQATTRHALNAVALDPEGHTSTPAMNWGATHRARAVAIFGLVMLLPLALSTAGWRRANTTADLDRATGGLALGVAGLVIALGVVAVYLWWLRVRVVQREGRVLRDYLLSQGRARLRRAARPAAAVALSAHSGRVLVVAGLGRFHRAGCPTLVGLEPSTVERATVDAGLTACGICGAE